MDAKIAARIVDALEAEVRETQRHIADQRAAARARGDPERPYMFMLAAVYYWPPADERLPMHFRVLVTSMKPMLSDAALDRAAVEEARRRFELDAMGTSFDEERVAVTGLTLLPTDEHVALWLQHPQRERDIIEGILAETKTAAAADAEAPTAAPLPSPDTPPQD